MIMPEKKLRGDYQDLIALKAIIEKYFNTRIEEEYIPEGFKCKVNILQRPIKSFQIQVMGVHGEREGVSIPFMPIIEDFGETAEKMIEQLVIAVEEKEKIKSR